MNFHYCNGVLLLGITASATGLTTSGTAQQSGQCSATPSAAQQTTVQNETVGARIGNF